MADSIFTALGPKYRHRLLIAFLGEAGSPTGIGRLIVSADACGDECRLLKLGPFIQIHKVAIVRAFLLH